MNQNHLKLNKAATILARIVEIVHWVAIGLFTGSLLAYLFKPEWMKYFMLVDDSQFELAGYSVKLTDASGALVPQIIIPVLIMSIILSGLIAMIFRNIYLIFQTSIGKTRFSKGETPFQPDNVRMVREIGIFSIAIPAVELAFDGLMRLIAQMEAFESSTSMLGVVYGIAFLCLSQFFAYGVQLQRDTDGLL